MQFTTLLLAATSLASANAYFVIGSRGPRGTGGAAFSTGDVSGNTTCRAVADFRSFTIVPGASETYPTTGFVYTNSACSAGEESIAVFARASVLFSGQATFRSYRIVVS